MNGTEHNLLVEAPNLAVIQMQTPTQIAVSQTPKLGALASLRLHWPEYIRDPANCHQRMAAGPFPAFCSSLSLNHLPGELSLVANGPPPKAAKSLSTGRALVGRVT